MYFLPCVKLLAYVVLFLMYRPFKKQIGRTTWREDRRDVETIDFEIRATSRKNKLDGMLGRP